MTPSSRSARSFAAAALLVAAVLGRAVAQSDLPETAAVPAEGDASFDLGSPFDWDLVSLEQSNPRFNASVLDRVRYGEAAAGEKKRIPVTL